MTNHIQALLTAGILLLYALVTGGMFRLTRQRVELGFCIVSSIGAIIATIATLITAPSWVYDVLDGIMILLTIAYLIVWFITSFVAHSSQV
jgi:hypothetical protein